MAKRSQRFKTVIFLAEFKEQEAARQLQQVRDQIDLETRQLAILHAYQQEYLAKLSAQQQGAVLARTLGNYHDFLARLDDSERQQQGKVQQMQQHLERVRDQWLQLHRRVEKLKDLYERYRREEDAASEARLQKELDELSQQRHHREQPSLVD